MELIENIIGPTTHKTKNRKYHTIDHSEVWHKPTWIAYSIA